MVRWFHGQWPVLAALVGLLAALYARPTRSTHPAQFTMAADSTAASTTTATAAPRVVLLTQSAGFVHDVVKPRGDGRPSVVEEVWADLARRGGFDVQAIADVRQLTPDLLGQTKLLVLYTTGELPVDNVAYEALERWLRDGGAFFGIHCATDTLKAHPKFPNLIGARFESHPWTANDTVTIKVHDAAHPAAKPYAPSATFREEIYQFDLFRADDVRVLMSLDMARTEKKRPHHVPVAWCRTVGDGRLFYTSLGHREDVWRSAAFQEHLLGATAWLLGQAEADATPNPDLHAAESAAAAQAVQAAK